MHCCWPLQFTIAPSYLKDLKELQECKGRVDALDTKIKHSEDIKSDLQQKLERQLAEVAISTLQMVGTKSLRILPCGIHLLLFASVSRCSISCVCLGTLFSCAK